ncbi:ParB/RepB/Spo0J family partition protein [Candidatus Margulisiibacteriota bacterium]
MTKIKAKGKSKLKKKTKTTTKVGLGRGLNSLLNGKGTKSLEMVRPFKGGEADIKKSPVIRHQSQSAVAVSSRPASPRLRRTSSRQSMKEEKVHVDQKLGKVVDKEYLSDDLLMNIPVDMIIRNPDQPRRKFNSRTIEELAKSIKNHGLAQPILVKQKGDKYELIAGERRWRASQLADIKTISAVVKGMKTKNSLMLSIIENIQRENLSAVEEAQAYKKLMVMNGWTQEDVARKLGKSRPYVTNMLRLLELPEAVRDSIMKREISPGHARTLLSLAGKEDMLMFYNLVMTKKISVRDLESAVRKYLKEKEKGKEKKNKNGQKSLFPELTEAADKMSSTLRTKVQIKGNNERGKIMIDYFNKEDLDRFLMFFGIG